jgi:hypothetical protein
MQILRRSSVCLAEISTAPEILPECLRSESLHNEVKNNKAVLSGPPEKATASGVEEWTPSKAS